MTCLGTPSYGALMDMYCKEKDRRVLVEEENKSLKEKLDKLQKDYNSLDEGYDTLANNYAELKELQDL